jgi:ribonuclease inhibitor
MSMKQCILDGNRVHSLDDLYDQLSTQLPFPSHFGRNLDALQDVLSTDIEGPFEIIWEHADDSRRLMGEDFDKALNVFQELKEERDDFKLQIEL